MEKITERIYRLRVPFEDLYTSVFFLLTEDGCAIVDCATTGADVDGYILPALKSLGVDKNSVKYLILTHKHGDHAGGKERMLEHFSTAMVVDRVLPLSIGGISICEMKGHTLDCIGVFDKESGSLISGDGLQGEGIGKYRCSLESKDEYVKTIEKIRSDKTIKRILFSHAYEPWYKDHATGEAEIEKCLSDCINCLQ